MKYCSEKIRSLANCTTNTLFTTFVTSQDFILTTLHLRHTTFMKALLMSRTSGRAVRLQYFSAYFHTKSYGYSYQTKAGFPLAKFYTRSDFFFCLRLISSAWLQPKAQGQRKKVASRENIR